MPQALDAVSALPGVEAAVARARAATDAVIMHQALRRRGADVALEASLRGARASAGLDGVVVDVEFLRSGNLRLDHPGRPSAQAALRVAQEVPGLLATWRSSPFQALARLHVVAAADLVDGGSALGRPREGEPIEQRPEFGPVPDAREVAPRLDLLSRILLEDDQTSAVVVAAVVHGELLALRPFGTRDALVARAASRLVLITRGLDPRGITVPDVGHLTLGQRTYEAAATGFSVEGPAGVARWIEHCADAIVEGADEAERICSAFA